MGRLYFKVSGPVEFVNAPLATCVLNYKNVCKYWLTHKLGNTCKTILPTVIQCMQYCKINNVETIEQTNVLGCFNLINNFWYIFLQQSIYLYKIIVAKYVQYCLETRETEKTK